MWSSFAKIPSVQSYFLTKIAPFQPLFNLLSKSVKFIHGQKSLKLPSVWPFFLTKIGLLQLLFTLQSKLLKFIFGENSLKYQVYSLTVWQKVPISALFYWTIKISEIDIWSQFANLRSVQPYFLGKFRSCQPLFTLQSKSVKLILGQNSPKYQVYSLTLWANQAQFIQLCMNTTVLEQNQSN